MNFDTYLNIGTGVAIVFILAFTAWVVVGSAQKDNELRASCESRNGYWFSARDGHVCLRKEAVIP